MQALVMYIPIYGKFLGIHRAYAENVFDEKRDGVKGRFVCRRGVALPNDLGLE
jgi:hypothetical protein